MTINENNTNEDSTVIEQEVDQSAETTDNTDKTVDTTEESLFSSRVDEIKKYLNAMNENEQIAYRLYSELFDMLDSLQDDFSCHLS